MPRKTPLRSTIDSEAQIALRRSLALTPPTRQYSDGGKTYLLPDGRDMRELDDSELRAIHPDSLPEVQRTARRYLISMADFWADPRFEKVPRL